jgi:hypothetical protein
MNHEVNEMKAFLVDWLFKFGRDYVKSYDIKRELLIEHEYATWSFSIDDEYIFECRKDGGNEYKLTKKGLRYLNKGEHDGTNE